MFSVFRKPCRQNCFKLQVASERFPSKIWTQTNSKLRLLDGFWWSPVPLGASDRLSWVQKRVFLARYFGKADKSKTVIRSHDNRIVVGRVTISVGLEGWEWSGCVPERLRDLTEPQNTAISHLRVWFKPASGTHIPDPSSLNFEISN